MMGVRIQALLARVLSDPRNLQVAVLASLLTYGALVLDFVLVPLAVPVTVLTGLALEGLLFRFRRAADRAAPPYKSALISSLSALLLFRSTEVWAYALVIAIAVASKLARVRGRHFINPTNGAVLAGSLLLPGWIASGQWGHDPVLIFALAGGASLILTRAGRLDSAAAFLAGALLGGALRHYVLGYRWAVIGHGFTNGAFWLFALYMITDPRTTPVRRSFRWVHGAAVGLLGVALAQLWWVRDSYLWALLVLAPSVPLLDALHRRRAEGGAGASGPRSPEGVPIHASPLAPR